MNYRASTSFREDWWRAPVVVAMVSPVQIANPEGSLTELAARLATSKIGAMPIVECGKVVGIVTTTDVLEAEVRAAMQ